jgi:hypothetical protein
MELDPEVHSHPHKVGHRWIDMVLASTALLVSIASIILAIQNESNMRRLVTANSWPYIALNQGNGKDGEAVLHFDAKNAGIGPAILEKLVVTYDGKAVGTSAELVDLCCASAGGRNAIHRVYIELVQGHVFTPREEISFFSVRKNDLDGPMWEKLNLERFKLGMSVCYSSVFGEHWISSSGKPTPVSVKSCDDLTGPAYDLHATLQNF